MSIVPLSSVRPIVQTPETDHEIMCGICGVNDEMDSDADDENIGAIKVKAVKNVYLPSQLEIDEHNLTHLPFRDWCPYCVQGSVAILAQAVWAQKYIHSVDTYIQYPMGP